MISLSMLTSGSLSVDMDLTGTSGNFWATRNVFFPLNHIFKLHEFTVYVSFCNDVFFKKKTEQVNYLNQVLTLLVSEAALLECTY